MKEKIMASFLFLSSDRKTQDLMARYFSENLPNETLISASNLDEALQAIMNRNRPDGIIIDGSDFEMGSNLVRFMSDWRKDIPFVFYGCQSPDYELLGSFGTLPHLTVPAPQKINFHPGWHKPEQIVVYFECVADAKAHKELLRTMKDFERKFSNGQRPAYVFNTKKPGQGLGHSS